MKNLTVHSQKQNELIEITAEVQRCIRDSGVKSGLAMLFVPHTTAAVTINENADPDVITDLLAELDKIVPLQDGYLHAEGNSAAHIKSTLVGASETLIINEGQAFLGRWQGIYFCEFDGPRTRQVQLKFLST